ncbi:hypothetical protein JST97_27730 [bacterium]|nr:hypothetical protein [bacterium]
MAKVLGFLVVLILLVLAVKMGFAALALFSKAATMMAALTSLAIFGCFAVGVFTVSRYMLKKRN